MTFYQRCKTLMQLSQRLEVISRASTLSSSGLPNHTPPPPHPSHCCAPRSVHACDPNHQRVRRSAPLAIRCAITRPCWCACHPAHCRNHFEVHWRNRNAERSRAQIPKLGRPIYSCRPWLLKVSNNGVTPSNTRFSYSPVTLNAHDRIHRFPRLGFVEVIELHERLQQRPGQ